MGKWRSALIVFLLMLFLAGLTIFLYPYWQGAVVEEVIQQQTREFLEQLEQTIPEDTSEGDGPSVPAATDPRQYPELYEDIASYNQSIYDSGQTGLSDPSAYQHPSFILADYGLESEIFGVLSIPALDFSMPIYLGATSQHMSDGVALLSQTSIPIGGENTNAVIAGHRGWYGADYLRYIEKLEIGDTVTITNLWETITYEVVETRIIEPNDVEEILIQPGKDMVTLLTCHPYASGGRQRYLVFCERTENS